jgi:hypothetical protein
MADNLDILIQEVEGLELDLGVLFKLKKEDPDIAKIIIPIVESIQKRLSIISVCYLNTYVKFKSVTIKSDEGDKKLNKDSLFSELLTNIILKVVLKLAVLNSDSLQACFTLFDKVSNRNTGVINSLNNIIELLNTFRPIKKEKDGED